MKKRHLTVFVALALIAVFALALVAACGGDDTSSTTSASPGTGGLTGTAAERAQTILGHAPAGLAADIVGKGKVIVANDANYPPQSSIDKATGDMVGFDVDVANKMAEILGLKIKFENPAWETIPAGLNQGSYDVSIGSMTSAIAGDRAATSTLVNRWKQMDFTEAYYYTSGQVFMKKGGEQVTDKSMLDGKKVGVGAATTYYDWLKQNTSANVKTYTTDADAFPDLANGNLDYVMTAGPTGQQAILQGQPFEFTGAPMYYEDLSMAVKKGETDWIALLNYAVKTMHEDGSLTEMSKKWYNGLDLTTKVDAAAAEASPTP
jgi:polar amino acid transport system substrate-binding protein